MAVIFPLATAIFCPTESLLHGLVGLYSNILAFE